MTIAIFVFGIILLIGLIVTHEFGHFIVARRNGVVAEEFGIFFGPTLYKRKTKAGWIFKFNLLPLGGYVKLKGEHDSDTEPGSYGAASLWVKTKIMSAGVVVNFLTGILLLTILALVGMPKILPNQFSINSNQHIVRQAASAVQVTGVQHGTPAYKAGLKPGDNITAIGTKNNLTTLTSSTSLEKTTSNDAGQTVIIHYTRNGKNLTTSTTLYSKTQAAAEGKQLKTNQPIYLGVSLNPLNVTNGVTIERFTWAAPVVAVGLTKQILVLTYQGVGLAFRGLGGIIAGVATSNSTARHNAQTTASSDVCGPICLVAVLKDTDFLGIQFMVFIIAVIAITLAIMNVLPIPALDGGRLYMTLITRATKHPMAANIEELAVAISLILILILFGFIAYVDIKRFI